MTNIAKRIASVKSLQIPICAIAILMCTVCGIEGGYQLHLSHEHSALGCLNLNLPILMDPGDPLDLATYTVAPPCKEPDELGQPWRLQLVLLDMLGFVAFGTLGFYKGKQMILASGAGD